MKVAPNADEYEEIQRGRRGSTCAQIAVPLAAADIIYTRSNLFQVSPQWNAIVTQRAALLRAVEFLPGWIHMEIKACVKTGSGALQLCTDLGPV